MGWFLNPVCFSFLWPGQLDRREFGGSDRLELFNGLLSGLPYRDILVLMVRPGYRGKEEHKMKNSQEVMTWTFALMVLLSGCKLNSYVQKDWFQTKTSGGTHATFELFSGLDHTNFNLKQGDDLTVYVEYSIESGSLAFRLVSQDGMVLWQSDKLDQSGSVTFGLQVPESGIYKIQYIGVQTKGGFEITWETSRTAEKAEA